MRRVGEAESHNAVMFLASDLASYITAVDLLVDGGTNASNGTFRFTDTLVEYRHTDGSKP